MPTAKRIYANYLRALQKQPSAPDTSPRIGVSALEFRRRPGFIVRPRNAQDDCLQRARSDPRMQAWLLQLAADPALRSCSCIVSSTTFCAPHTLAVITWASFMQAKELFLTSVAIDCARSRMDSCIGRLQSDAAFTAGALANPKFSCSTKSY